MTHPFPALLITQLAALILGAPVYVNNPKRLVSRPFLALSLHLALWAFLVLTHGFDQKNGRNILQKI
jgi:hypothetical protein